jgi:dolichol-phosphate mannosyltransferase
MDLSIVIPCYNEAESIDQLAETLGPVVQELRRDHSVEVVFVDDGSTDSTGALLMQRFVDDRNVRVVPHPKNLGLGAALRTGLSAASGDIVVTTDSDGTYGFGLIVPMLAELGPEVDIVTASCYHPRGGIDNVPAYRIFLSRSASFLYRVILDRRIHTYTCLFRVYRRRVIETVPFQSNGFLSVTELLAGALLQGYTVREYPCVLHARRYGASKAKVARIISAHLRYQLRLLQIRGLALARAGGSRSASRVGPR